MTGTMISNAAAERWTYTVAGVLALCCAFGCTAEPTPPSDFDECGEGSYIGLLDGRDECGDFAGSKGAWLGEPLFSLQEGYLQRFCRYTWADEDGALPEAGSLPNTADGVVGLVRDCPVVIPQGDAFGTDARFRELLHAAFKARVGQPIVPQDPIENRLVTLSLVDTIPEALITSGIDPNARHGLTLREIVEGLVCDGDRCIAEVSNVLGLPRLGGDRERIDLERGGYYGTLTDLARGVVESTSTWLHQTKTPHLVMVLAVGWEPRGLLGPLALLDAPIERLLTPAAVDAVPTPVQAILAAIVYASCEDAIIIASAGNEGAAPCEQSGAVGPGFLTRLGAPSSEACARLGFRSNARKDMSGPLVHAVSHVGLDGAPLSNARSGATASLVAPGVAFGTADGTSEMLTGSSVAAAATAVTAAWIWSYFPDLTGAEVMQIVYESGRPLPGGGASDFQLGARPLEARQVSTCDALVAACRYTPSASCEPPPGCVALPDRRLELAANGATMLACAEESAHRITVGANFGGSAEATNACGQTSVTWPATALPETSPPAWPWAEPTPPVTYCPRCIAVLSAAPQHLTVGLALSALLDTSYPVVIEVKTSGGIHQFPLDPSDLHPDRTNIVDIVPAAAWSEVTGARLVYFARDLRGDLVTRGDPLLVLAGQGGQPEDIKCSSPTCGDGMILVGLEQCDDGNGINTDACTNMCKTPLCGDGIITPSIGEQCEDGNNHNTDKCSACKNTFCGDRRIQSPNGANQSEMCDDGNKIDNDGCNNLCQPNPG